MTRAKDISKIITDADFSGTLDVTGLATVGGLKLGHQNYISWADSGGTNRNVIQFDTDTLKIGVSGNVDNTIIRSNGADRIKADSNGDISFYEDTGTTPKLFWDASAERLGIGHSSPNVTLHVQGANVSSGDANHNVVIDDTTSMAQGVGGGIVFRGNYGSGLTNGGFIQTEKSNATSGNYAFDLVLGSRTNGSSPAERMRIDSSGNVGIGTQSPDRTLVVKTADGDGIGIENAAGNQYRLAVTSDDAFAAIDSGTAERLRITSAGKVGIGTTSPNTTLTTNSASEAVGISAQSTTTGSFIGFKDATSTNWYYNHVGAVGDNLKFTTAGGERMRINSSGNVGIGTNSPDSKLDVATGANGVIFRYDAASTFLQILPEDTGGDISLRYRANSGSAPDLLFKNDGGTERMRITEGGNVGIGTSSPVLPLDVNGSAQVSGRMLVGSVGSGGGVGQGYQFAGDGNTGMYQDAYDQLQFSTNNAERMRINSSGQVLINKTSTGAFNDGVLLSSGGNNFSRDSNTVIDVHRGGSDGNIIAFYAQSTFEGSISVSGTTVTYGGGHLGRWSRLLDNSKDSTILKGTVMTNLDEMVEWGDEDNEQLNKMAVSSVEGDANVAGVFVSWDNDDEYNDMMIAMTGDMVIRIAQGITVARGDLLMSAGDGTAKPQGDDIVRSKTIAKVTSTNVSHTYDDGTYLVPCVLMAC
jgi:hypothetical protein